MSLLSIDVNGNEIQVVTYKLNKISYKTDSMIDYSNFEQNDIQNKKEELIKQFEIEIKNVIHNDEFIDGTITNSEKYMYENYNTNTDNFIKTALMNLYLRNLSNSKVLTGILMMISTISYSQAEPEGPIMAIGLLQNKDNEIRDKAIQAFERWNSKKGISVLKSLKCDKKWLQLYVDKVIAYIERDGVD